MSSDRDTPESDETPVPHQIRDAIEESDWPELSLREVMDATGLSKDQILGAAGRGHGLEIDETTGAVRLIEDDGGEFVDDYERELRSDGGRPSDAISRRECRYCSEVFKPHPGFADHQDVCPLNPMNRPHITGTANAPGVEIRVVGAEVDHD